MRTATPVALACLAVSTLALAGAQDAGAPARFAPAFDMAGLDMQAGMQAQMDSMTPGEHHELLKYFAGDWDVEMEMTSPMMGQKVTSKGETSCEMILGGRFLHASGTLDFPGMGPSESVAIMGFDTFANRYDLTMISTMNNATYRATGMPNQDGTAIVFYGPMDEPMLNFRQRAVRYTYRLIDENSYRVEIDDLAIADPATERVLTITYTRKDD
ncbi:MAG: hypothetical protein Tsb0013_23420 [Phycisphaerales bacterium]